MSERSFRDQSPAPSGQVPAARDAPPVPALPPTGDRIAGPTSRQVPHRRVVSIEPPDRIGSPPIRNAIGRGSSLNQEAAHLRSERPVDPRVLAAQAKRPSSATDDRPSPNFSYPKRPLSPSTDQIGLAPSNTAATSNRKISTTSPAASDASSTPEKRSKKKIVRPAEAHDDRSVAQNTGTHTLTSQGKQVLGVITDSGNTRVPVQSLPVDDEQLSEDASSQTTAVKRPGKLAKRPSVVHEDAEGEQEEESSPTAEPVKRNGDLALGSASHQQPRRNRPLRVNATSSTSDKAGNSESPAEECTACSSRPPSLSPSRAHFNVKPVNHDLQVKHEPLGRSISPGKSAMKHSPAVSIDMNQHLAHDYGRPSTYAASDVSDNQSVGSNEASPLAVAQRKRMNRVSFDETANTIGLAVRSVPNTDSPRILSPQEKPPHDMFAPQQIKTKPILPSFTSVGRDRKESGEDHVRRQSSVSKQKLALQTGSRNSGDITNLLTTSADQAPPIHDADASSSHAKQPPSRSNGPGRDREALGDNGVSTLPSDTRGVPAIAITAASPSVRQRGAEDRDPSPPGSFPDAPTAAAKASSVDPPPGPSSTDPAQTSVAALIPAQKAQSKVQPTEVEDNSASRVQDPDESDTSVYSDASENISENDDYPSIATIIHSDPSSPSQITPKNKMPLREGRQESSPLAQSTLPPNDTGTEPSPEAGWDAASAYWKNLSTQKRNQLERAASPQEETSAPPPKPRPAAAKKAPKPIGAPRVLSSSGSETEKEIIPVRTKKTRPRKQPVVPDDLNQPFSQLSQRADSQPSTAISGEMTGTSGSIVRPMKASMRPRSSQGSQTTMKSSMRSSAETVQRPSTAIVASRPDSMFQQHEPKGRLQKRHIPTQSASTIPNTDAKTGSSAAKSAADSSTMRKPRKARQPPSSYSRAAQEQQAALAMAEDSDDSMTARRRARAATRGAGGFTMRTMRASPAPPSNDLRANQSKAETKGSRFRISSLSPSRSGLGGKGNRLSRDDDQGSIISGTGSARRDQGLRSSTRESSDRPVRTLRNRANSNESRSPVRGLFGRKREANLGRPISTGGFRSRFSHDSDDDADSDLGPKSGKKRSGRAAAVSGVTGAGSHFRSRFADSSDEDDEAHRAKNTVEYDARNRDTTNLAAIPVSLVRPSTATSSRPGTAIKHKLVRGPESPTGFTPVRGIPRPSETDNSPGAGADDGDSTDLVDSDLDVQPNQGVAKTKGATVPNADGVKKGNEGSRLGKGTLRDSKHAPSSSIGTVISPTSTALTSPQTVNVPYPSSPPVTESSQLLEKAAGPTTASEVEGAQSLDHGSSRRRLSAFFHRSSKRSSSYISQLRPETPSTDHLSETPLSPVPAIPDAYRTGSTSVKAETGSRPITNGRTGSHLMPETSRPGTATQAPVLPEFKFDEHSKHSTRDHSPMPLQDAIAARNNSLGSGPAASKPDLGSRRVSSPPAVGGSKFDTKQPPVISKRASSYRQPALLTNGGLGASKYAPGNEPSSPATEASPTIMEADTGSGPATDGGKKLPGELDMSRTVPDERPVLGKETRFEGVNSVEGTVGKVLKKKRFGRLRKAFRLDT